MGNDRQTGLVSVSDAFIVVFLLFMLVGPYQAHSSAQVHFGVESSELQVTSHVSAASIELEETSVLTATIKNNLTKKAYDLKYTATFPSALSYKKIVASAGWSCVRSGPNSAMCVREFFDGGEQSTITLTLVGKRAGSSLAVKSEISSLFEDTKPENNSHISRISVNDVPVVVDGACGKNPSSAPLCTYVVPNYSAAAPGEPYLTELWLEANQAIDGHLQLRLWWPDVAPIENLVVHGDAKDNFVCDFSDKTYLSCMHNTVLAKGSRLSLQLTVVVPDKGDGWRSLHNRYRLNYEAGGRSYLAQVPVSVAIASSELAKNHPPAVFPGQWFELKDVAVVGLFHPEIYAEDWDGNFKEFSISNVDASVLSINSSTGKLSIENYDELDNLADVYREVPVNIDVVDVNGERGVGTVVLKLPGVGDSANHPPKFAEKSEYEVFLPKGVSGEVVVARINVTDPDNDPFELKISAGNFCAGTSGPLVFNIANNGDLSVINPGVFEYCANPDFELKIIADDGKLSGQSLKTIFVKRGSAPSGPASGGKAVSRNSSGGALGFVLLWSLVATCLIRGMVLRQRGRELG